MVGIYKVNGKVIKIPIHSAHENQIEFMKQYCLMHGIEFSVDKESTINEIELDGRIITREKFAEILMQLEKEKIEKHKRTVESVYNNFINSINWTVGPDEGEKYDKIV